MKRIIAFSMMIMLVGGLAFSQAQDPGFSNTAHIGLGNVDPGSEDILGADTDFKFGIANYFTARFDVGKITVAGDIQWTLGFVPKFAAGIHDWNFNAVMKPFKGFSIGLGTNLDWTVGPAPTSGPDFSAYDVPYYAGLSALEGPSTGLIPKKSVHAGIVKNAFADAAFAVRYAFEDIIQVGVSLGDLEETVSEIKFMLGIGVKANIMDIFTIGFAYNGDFKTSDNNSLYFGSTISAIKKAPIDIWLNFVPNGKDNKNGQNTFGGRVDFTAGPVRIVPEFSVTIWNKENKGASTYIALDLYGTIATQMIIGIDASWGLGSNKATNVDDNHAGARLNINPYFIWNLNDKNKLSIGVHIMPVWWPTGGAGVAGESNVFWSVPIAWRVEF